MFSVLLLLLEAYKVRGGLYELTLIKSSRILRQIEGTLNSVNFSRFTITINPPGIVFAAY